MTTENTEFLGWSITCKDCDGLGFGEDQKMCETCGGVGSIIDSTIPEIIKKFVPNILNGDLVKMSREIIDHVIYKIEDSFERGKLEVSLENKIKLNKKVGG